MAPFNHLAFLPLGCNATSASKLTTGSAEASKQPLPIDPMSTLQAIIVNCDMA
ncbi:hypothetical protein [Rhizobium aethiopicum]|uniref:hypothetical protein n=1 Tax=Rhizobium aethiopicum TaxID=1138170 RepID=UPI001AED9105|nr:hypothetical protein [Rhizobium aethiopicum]